MSSSFLSLAFLTSTAFHPNRFQHSKILFMSIPARPSQELAAYITAVIAQIPPGKVATYGQIAKLAGLPKHARLVGYVLKHLAQGHVLPWHRVLNAQGKISLSKINAQGENIQALKLIQEGVVVLNNKVSLKQYQWQP